MEDGLEQMTSSYLNTRLQSENKEKKKLIFVTRIMIKKNV